MADGQTTLTIHGLDEDNKLVRASVLAQKLQALVAGLKAADKFANDGQAAHSFIVAEMKVSSALIQIREHRRTSVVSVRSGVEAYLSSVEAIYRGDANVGALPDKLVKSVRRLSSGATVKFAHAEIGEGTNVVRIDQYLLGQASRAVDAVEQVHAESKPHYFHGVAQSSLDGTLQVLDSRGTAILAKLITTAGRKEIDCVVNRLRIPNAGDYFDKRVILEGAAHYDGIRPLPVRIDVARISAVKKDPDLRRWRGAFRASEEDAWQ